MNNTKLVDTGFVYFIVRRECSHSISEIRSYVVSHGYTLGDGTTFAIMHPSVSPETVPYILPAYGDPLGIAEIHAKSMGAITYTTVDYHLDILDMTKYTLSSSGEVILEGVTLPMTQTDAAYVKGIQYNRGDPILTFKALSSYILSMYNWDNTGVVMCDSTHKYAVRSTSPGTLRILPGILLYEWSC